VTEGLFTVAICLGFGLFLSLAYAAASQPLLRYLVYLGLGIADAIGLLSGAAFALVLFLDIEMVAPTGTEGMVAATAAVGPLIATLSAIGFLLLLEPFRRLLARLIPFDPRSLVHTVALHYALAVIAIGALLGATWAAAAEDPALLDTLTESVEAAGLAAAWLQMAGFVVLALLGVGLLVTRDWRATLERLGVTGEIHWRWLVAVPLLGLLSGGLVDLWWQTIDPAGMADVSRLSEELFGPFIAAGLAGVITVAVSAGVGEELLFRGALQPRFGIAATSLLFTALHTQYTISPALVQVFVLSVLLGLARRRGNTTTSILAHAAYNGILVALAVYAPELSP
jgi:membrane protease YdiL (CAAX protease family)